MSTICTSIRSRKSSRETAFHNLLLDSRGRHVHNLFNGVLLHTLNTGRKRTKDCEAEASTAEIEICGFTKPVMSHT